MAHSIDPTMDGDFREWNAALLGAAQLPLRGDVRALFTKPIPHVYGALEELVAPLGEQRSHSGPLAFFLGELVKQGVLTADESQVIYRLHGIIMASSGSHHTPSSYQWKNAIALRGRVSPVAFTNALRRTGMNAPGDASAVALEEVRGIMENAMARWGEAEKLSISMAPTTLRLEEAMPGEFLHSFPSNWFFSLHRGKLGTHWMAMIHWWVDGEDHPLLALLKATYKLMMSDQVSPALFHARAMEPSPLDILHFLSLASEYNVEWAGASFQWDDSHVELPSPAPRLSP